MNISISINTYCNGKVQKPKWLLKITRTVPYKVYTMLGNNAGTQVSWESRGTPDGTGARSGIVPYPTDIRIGSVVEVGI